METKTPNPIWNILKKIGFFLLYLTLTLIFIGVAIYIMDNVYHLYKYVLALPMILALFFWGIILLRTHGFAKIMGVVFFLTAVLSNLLLLATPYDTQAEFTATRIYIITGLASGIYLIFRKSIASRIFGISIIITILAALFGAMFVFVKLPPA